MIDRKKILERIKKLLAMADDASSPNEAAIAARRAKKLMDEHNVTHADAIAGHMTLDDFVEGQAGPDYRRYPAWMQHLAVSVARYADCNARWDYTPRARKVIKFQGEASDLELARYLFTYLIRTIDRLCAEAQIGWPAGRDSFKRGAVSEISKKLEAMKAEEKAWFADPTRQKALVVVDKKLAMRKQKFGVAKYGKSSSAASDGTAYMGGKAAGAGVSIRRGVAGTNRGAAGYLK